jgi:hypothetical protein
MGVVWGSVLLLILLGLGIAALIQIRRSFGLSNPSNKTEDARFNAILNAEIARMKQQKPPSDR